MNYFHQLKAFRIRHKLCQLSAPDIALWHALMCIGNEIGQYNGLSLAISTLADESGMSVAAVKRSRNRLKQSGFIDWDSRSGRQSAVYKVVDISFVAQCEPQSVPQPVPQSVPQPVPQSVPIYKQYNTKPDEVVGCARDGCFLSDEEADALLPQQQAIDSVVTLARSLGLNDRDYELINRLAADYNVDWCIAALNRARETAKGVPSWRYIERILQGFRSAGGPDKDGKQPQNQPKQGKTDKQRFEERRTELILAGRHEDAARLTMNDVKGGAEHEYPA